MQVALALANLGVGPMPAYESQGETLDDEVNSYLTAPPKVANITEFWQVCRNGLFC